MGLFGGNKNIDIPLLNLASEGWKTYAEEFKNLAPDANVGVLETSGHAMFSDEEEQFSHLLQEFIEAIEY